MTAPECGFEGCTRVVRNGHFRCFGHRPPGRPPRPLGMQVVSAADEETWKPGTVHPTGGFDDRFRDAADRTHHFLHGYLHRLDGPASVYRGSAGVIEEWWIEGERHREEGPAVLGLYGAFGWWHRGREHRVGGPAIGGDGEGEGWFEHGKKHRLDGPAVRNFRGEHEWWIQGVRYEQAEHARIVEALDSGAPLEWARAFGCALIV